MSDTQIKEWFRRFKDGRVSVDSDLRSDRPSTSKTALFPKLKHPLKGKRFDNVEEIKRNVTRELLAITKKDFQDSFRKWVHR
ncbi:hypothetical protein X777_05149 [Ooceraea biroi]|uniref:Mos1 transposase HTH domain-containing protein n=1 Tax=Ooceraea biroi TaxID=2015173 RepID=A0A026X1N2_OOCBI|nr:hypothetical protein X777_05149 [Ooceraea biroi]